VGIDQGMTAVKREVHPEGHDKYMGRVEALITQIVTKVLVYIIYLLFF
jgi:hypothetical protein